MASQLVEPLFCDSVVTQSMFEVQSMSLLRGYVLRHPLLFWTRRFTDFIFLNLGNCKFAMTRGRDEVNCYC